MKTFVYFIIALLLTACANPPGAQELLTEAGSQCKANVAQIAVFDGFMQHLCGCSEPTLAPVLTGTLTCTVPAGTTVFFQYVGTLYEHEILSMGEPSFVSSPVAKPGQFTAYPAHVVPFTTVGTYQFIDAYNGALTGEIVVQ